MLQLPQRASAKFTKADIAEIARGAVTVRHRSKPARPKLDPVIKLVEQYRACVESHKAAIADLKAFYASHEPTEVKPAVVSLPSLAIMTLHGAVQNCDFYDIPSIEVWANEARKIYRAILRGHPKDEWSKSITRAQARKYIGEVNKLEPELKRTLRRRMKIVKQRWADSGYQPLVDRHHRTREAMIDSRHKLCTAQATSFAGVSAVLSLLQDQAWSEFCGHLLDLEMPPVGRKKVLANLESAIAELMPEARKQ